MTDDEWGSRLIRVAAAQIKRYRKVRGLSAQEVADACTEVYGLPMKRSVLANLESGRRPTLSLMELLVLAKILQVPPLLLVFPVGTEENIEVLPGVMVNTWDAAKWFTGESPLVLGRGDPHGAIADVFDGDPETIRAIRAESVEYDSDDYAAWQGGNAVQLFREHDRLINELRAALIRVGAARMRADRTDNEQFRAGALHMADAEHLRASEYEGQLRASRAQMRSMGLVPLALPVDLADLEDAGANGSDRPQSV